LLIYIGTQVVTKTIVG